MIRKILLHTLCVLLGATFLFSGYLKLFPIEPFELNFIDIGIASWTTAPYIARLLIATEFFLGAMLIAGLFLKRGTLPATIILLVIFSVYLFYELATEGNTGNCGCFGTVLQMTPLQSLLKNAAMLAAATILYFFHSGFKFRFDGLVAYLFAGVAVALPFVINPPDAFVMQNASPEALDYPLDFSLFESDTLVNHADVSSLQSGKHIVAFVSSTCPHCIAATLKMHVMFHQQPEIPFYIFINGKPENIEKFWSETKAENIPHSRITGSPFLKLSGGRVPAIFWLEDGVVKKKSLYSTLNEDEILQWMKE